MPGERIFAMGKFEARFPDDRRYVRSHMWLVAGDAGFRVGFTAYAVRLLQDVYFLDWSIDPQTDVRVKQEIGQVESSKAVSSLYPPAAGRVIAFNPALLQDPSLINTDFYGAGWLYDFTTDSPLWTVDEYMDHLNATWDETQRHLKSQYNE